MALLAAATLLAPTARSAPASGSSDAVRVVVDMDAATPGIQRSVSIPANCSVVQGIAIHAYDPVGGRKLWGIGYLGGLDRGIAFGHVPSNQNRGEVVSLVPHAGTPINPGNTMSELLHPAQYPGFPGAEVQYLEWGAEQNGAIRSAPDAAVFTVDVNLAGAKPGDVFAFHLLDMVTVWSGGTYGAFSTQAPINSLDTGGDAVPDGTLTAYGVDPDTALDVPPAAFRVDYVDGPSTGGPATIVVSPSLDVDPSGLAGQAFTLLAIEPNPAFGPATVRFELAGPGAVQLGVYDPAGRLVRELVRPSATLPSGPHAVAWDGRDERGRLAPAGVYFVKLGLGGRFEARPLVRLQ